MDSSRFLWFILPCSRFIGKKWSISWGPLYPRKAVPAVPLCEKWLLSIEEASIYFGVGQNRLAKLALQDGCKFVVFVGNKKLIKRKKFEEFLDEQYAI